MCVDMEKQRILSLKLSKPGLLGFKLVYSNGVIVMLYFKVSFKMKI